MNILKSSENQKKNNTENMTNIKNEYVEIVFSGSGGQGIILAGKILAEAASLYDNKEAAMTMSYGPEARGGASKAEIIISSAPIDYPKVTRPCVLIALNQESMNKYGNILADGGLLIADESLVKTIPSSIKNVFKAPFTTLATKILEAPIVANIVCLGAVAALTNVVSREALIKTVITRVSEKALLVDRVALDIGYKIVREANR